MDTVELISTYFPNLTALQLQQFAQLEGLYKEWNSQINVISRKDIDNLYLHHVLHSLSIAKLVQFKPGTEIIDLGTGGGFPGIPLAIYFPDVRFHLIDGTNKKLKVVQAVVDALGLKNVSVQHKRAEDFGHKVDFVMARAVAPMEKLWLWSERLISMKQKNALPNGLIALKGGNVEAEIEQFERHFIEINPIIDFFDEDYFEEKYILYLQK